jgi:hypothetical protein
VAIGARYPASYEPRVVDTRVAQSFSIASLIAIGCAIASFWAGAMWGVVLAIAAIAFGLIGAASAVSPRTRGGVVSMFSVFAGVVGIIAAAIKLIAYFF